MPRIANRHCTVECNDCRSQFEALWPHEMLGSDEGDTGWWLPMRENARAVRCPRCGSGRINPNPVPGER